MRGVVCCSAVGVVLLVGALAVGGAVASEHVVAAPAGMQWGDAPPIFEAGASMAVISGDPSQEGQYVVRLRMPAGYKVAPHWHPTDENVTVISGTIAIGMGESWDDGALQELPAGGFVMLPAEMRHYAKAMTEAEIQVHGPGPFTLTYVDPADDPTQR